MDISAVSAPPPVFVKPPEANDVKKPETTEVKPADLQNGAAADGTRPSQSTPLPPLPPGQGTRVDQLA
jgi:hypothetical protein